MKNFEIVRNKTKGRKRSLRCKVIFVAMISIVGYALGFLQFSPLYAKQDKEIDQNEAPMKREWRQEEDDSSLVNIRRKTANLSTVHVPADGNNTIRKVSESSEIIHKKRNTEIRSLKSDVGIIQQNQGVTIERPSGQNSEHQQNTLTDGQSSGSVRGTRSVGESMKIVHVNNKEESTGEDMNNLNSEQEPKLVTPAQKKRDRKKPKAPIIKPPETVDIPIVSSSPSATDILKAEMESKKAQVELLSLPIINDHNFEYIRNPVSACAASRTDVLFVVPSAPGNFKRRATTRNSSRAGYARDPSQNAKLVFFIGRPACGNDSAKIQAQIDDEFHAYTDIVQENFEDVYKNIRLKAVSMLRWSVTHCSGAKFVIRTDDDVTVNVPKIISIMESKSKLHSDFIIGDRKDGWKPVRKTQAKFLKYFVSEAEYPDPTYPPFAVGGLLGYPLSTVSLLYQAALRVKPLWLDDVFITGICAARLRIPLLKDPDFVFKHPITTS